MSFAEALAKASSRSCDPETLAELAAKALEAGEEDRGLPLLDRAVGKRPTARLWQWKGLLERALEDLGAAVASFKQAARLDPFDASIARGRARVALEAGLPAEALYEQARRIEPANGELIIGLAAARMAAGRGEQAERELDSILAQAPLWIQGHMQLAQLRSMLGRANAAAASLERAVARLPGNAELWRALFELHVKREDFGRLAETLNRAREAGAPPASLLPYEAICAAELGHTKQADGLFDQVERNLGPALRIWWIRHLLRSGRAAQALPLIDAELATDRAGEAWPYASLAWRLTKDRRSKWLEADPRQVSVIDLSAGLPPLDRLADVLRSLHVAKGEYLDQSVRGGTQTDGPLFSRIEPEIRATRQAVVRAVERYVAQLPDVDPAHPMLSRRRDRRVRFAGSWSVRLRGAGYHSSHVHPQGWISSALYIALPSRERDGNPQAGWLTMGEPPPGLPLDIEPTQRIEPKPGQLVLFPSWMWHGTIPFPAGERLAIAFDVAVPR